MLVIGITGSVGTGKSTVTKIFGELGARVLDADLIAHEAMRTGSVAWRRIVQEFGEEILQPDRSIDRQQLGQLVFADAAARQRLEAIVHPQVIKAMRRTLHAWKKNGRDLVVVLDVPLLLEANLASMVDVVVVVRADAAVQRQRLAEQRGWSAAEIERRIGAQWPLSSKEERADEVVENSGTLSETRRQVRQLWKKQSAAHKNAPTARRLA